MSQDDHHYIIDKEYRDGPDGSEDYSYNLKDLTGFYNKTNIIEFDKYQECVLETCTFVIEHLKKICGPLANNAMFVVNRPAGGTNHIFSKDGINMLKVIEFHNPIQKDIVNAIIDLGTAVDSTAGDGSTTTMLFATYLLKELFSHDFNNYPQLQNLSLQEIRTTYKAYFQEILKQLEKTYKLTMPEIQKFDDKLKEKLIYQQVLHSTHGNTAFAETLTELLKNIPDDRLASISYTESNRSDSPELEIFYPEYDYTSQVYCHTPQSNNANFNTELIYTDVRLIILENLTIDILQHLIELNDMSDHTKDIIFFASHVDAAALIRLSQLKGDDKFFNNYSVFSFVGMNADKRKHPLQSLVIPAIAYIASSNDDYFCGKISDVNCNKVEFKYGKNMYFYGLCHPIMDDLHIHHYLDSPEHLHPMYHQLLKNVTQHLEELKASPSNMSTEIGWLEEVLDSLIIPRKPKLILGGEIHQRNSNKDLFHDAVKSLLPILTDGLYIGLLHNLKMTMTWFTEYPIINQMLLRILEPLDNYINSQVSTRTHLPIVNLNMQEYKSTILEFLNASDDNLHVAINASCVLEIFFEKLINIIMMRYVSYVTYQHAIYDPNKSNQDKV